MARPPPDEPSVSFNTRFRESTMAALAARAQRDGVTMKLVLCRALRLRPQDSCRGPEGRHAAAEIRLMHDLPAWMGPAEFTPFGAKWGAVRCPHEFDDLMRRPGGQWEAGSHRWLVERPRLGPLMRKLQRNTIRCSGRRGSTWMTSRQTDRRSGNERPL
jgi:hypothetical protein